MAEGNEPKTPPSAESKTKAQAEFDRYKERMGSPQALNRAFVYPVGFEQAAKGVPNWAFPPSVAVLPEPPDMRGSLTERLGTTVRLGVDIVNMALAGGIRILGGLASGAYGYGEHAWSLSSCEACCSSCDPCETECECHNCCGSCGCGGRCQPSVGTCC